MCWLGTCGAVWSARRPVKPEVAGSNPVRSATSVRRGGGRVAQLVERAPEKREVRGSIPRPTTKKFLVRGLRLSPAHHDGTSRAPYVPQWIGVPVAQDSPTWLTLLPSRRVARVAECGSSGPPDSSLPSSGARPLVAGERADEPGRPTSSRSSVLRGQLRCPLWGLASRRFLRSPKAASPKPEWRPRS